MGRPARIFVGWSCESLGVANERCNEGECNALYFSTDCRFGSFTSQLSEAVADFGPPTTVEFRPAE